VPDPIRMPLSIASLPPGEAWRIGRSQGVNHVLAWLQARGLDALSAEYVEMVERERARP
jgi:hypothetical protein